MEDKIKKQSIDRLNISVSILEGLKQNNIIKIEDLCKKSKKELKKLGFLQNEINERNIELQLLGLALKNTL